ncbi:uncharacterized protein E0L32_011123 [Thyridium curvatum]|uniref:Uncharacterized protein n=1 Tax=Thyridium curvatum TaxID=1093900 RepID=A0A507AQ41_9PEZI|nr:uncharacterized protein E0L32_011123 [Thyridium curvatum]TPX06978.1 hypothetical protein E0L32_011123 [Thyridium curvatum]
MAKIMGAIRPSLPVLLVSIGLLIIAFHIAIRRSGCMASRVKAIRKRLALRRQEKRERRLKKALNRVARRLARRSARKERVARFKCLLSRLAFWRRDASAEQQDEEKAPCLREEPQQTSSMADEIAEFRAAVSIVDDMVSDQESKSRQSKPAASERSGTATSSAFVEYVLNDEDLLPTYEATQSVSDGSSADGGVYTPGTSSSTASADEAYDEKR